MKSHLAAFCAALALAGAPSSFAAANPGPPQDAGAGKSMSDANVPDTQPDPESAAVRGDTRTGARPGHTAAPAPKFVDEPVASAGTTQGPDAALTTSIVKALNGDASLRESKIAVLGEDGKVILSGATNTIEQRKAAMRIAEAQAGQGNVVNAMQATDSSTENQAPQPKT